MNNQPTPPFTIEELAAKLEQAYNNNMIVIRALQGAIPGMTNEQKEKTFYGALKECNSGLQELIAIVDQKKRDLDSINPTVNTSKVMTDTLETEKPEFHVTGVQLIENKILVGTSLYSTVIKARKIKDILNQKFAELRVDHVAKLVNYPVF